MKEKNLFCGAVLLAAFLIWTLLVMTVDVKAAGPNQSAVGFATWNCWFHQLTGVHMRLYTLTDWLGLVPAVVCMMFGGLGLYQWIRRRSLCKVDRDIILLGVYYVLVIAGYLLFEMMPINYRPILIECRLEASYPSSTTLLVLSVMPTLVFQAERKLQNPAVVKTIRLITILFSTFMIIGRLIAGVHWFTDIVGAVLLSAGLFHLYKAAAYAFEK